MSSPLKPHLAVISRHDKFTPLVPFWMDDLSSSFLFLETCSVDGAGGGAAVLDEDDRVVVEGGEFRGGGGSPSTGPGTD